ncbi:respiratory nitrate reductase subunit gamma [Myxococcus xanthus]|uniref:respiratory nitrate reductase subunit gamma n=1 Tax=Myxococcus xanthus TaxID=34 RepID=UPI00112AD899|nr:respiratory nitrate reductase subunit gamma [Myxococcus xanthus]QDE85131.1 nitrate reductase [Myxococcus xanthus]QDF06988.1 nitrate reductase [Myxococcus xanthus]
MSEALFSAIPYVAAGAAVAGVARRLMARAPASAPTPWTLSGRAVLAGAAIVGLNHLLGLLAPRVMQAFNASPGRLFTLEAVSLIGALLLAWGLAGLTVRRVREGQWSTAALLGLLFAQSLSGIYLAVAVRWGSAWYVHVVVPYLRSVLAFQPDASLLAQAPFIVQFHTLFGMVVLALALFIRARPEPITAPLLVTPREETAR